jgi:hypothetical protein
MSQTGGFPEFAGDGVRRLLGVLAAMSPRRWWGELDAHVPASESAFLSGVATFFAAAIIGVPAFLTYATALAAELNRVALQTPGLQGAGAGSVLMMLSLLSFLVLEPIGWLTGYLGLTGFIRALAGWFGYGFGDPVLTGLDALILRSAHSGRVHIERIRHNRHAGPEMPDRIVGAAHLGLDGADFVLVCSRPKRDWDQGTVVLTEEGAFRVGAIEERTIAGRLRTLYPLTEHKDLEVFRRVVHYRLPPGRRV